MFDLYGAAAACCERPAVTVALQILETRFEASCRKHVRTVNGTQPIEVAARLAAIT